jgi:Cytochrome c7 and related cytochrome c
VRRALTNFSVLACVTMMLSPAYLRSQPRSYFQSDDSAQSQTAQQEVPNNPLHPPAPEQPIPFSHRLHSEQGVTCVYCHTNPKPSALMTFPPASTCMGCHRVIAKDKPAIQKLTKFASSKQPIPWVRVYSARPGLRWTHSPHLQAEKTCDACHGPVEQMDRMSEVTSTTTMYSCLSCHQKNHAKTECKTCHLWP